MKKINLAVIMTILVISQFSCNSASSGSGNGIANQIIADHTIVADYSKIPDAYIAKVKKMWINIAGESHSQAYRTGLIDLQALDSKFQASVTEDSVAPEGATDLYLRSNRAVRTPYSAWGFGTGESTWYTNAAGKTELLNHIIYCHDNNLDLSVIGFGWCWDMSWTNGPSGTADPVYKVRWAGTSVGGAQGDMIWGLDAEDTALTGNSICMDTYLQATEEYIQYCKTNNYTTKVIFTTGPVDSYNGENGYQRQLKHDYIRNYVKADKTRILFDYADILSYNDSNVQNTESWNDADSVAHTYQMIHADNLGDASIGHIGANGALRLAKAQWWLLARIAGWDGK